jgi:hypothetical protein
MGSQTRPPRIGSVCVTPVTRTPRTSTRVTFSLCAGDNRPGCSGGQIIRAMRPKTTFGQLSARAYRCRNDRAARVSIENPYTGCGITRVKQGIPCLYRSHATPGWSPRRSSRRSPRSDGAGAATGAAPSTTCTSRPTDTHGQARPGRRAEPARGRPALETRRASFQWLAAKRSPETSPRRRDWRNGTRMWIPARREACSSAETVAAVPQHRPGFSSLAHSAVSGRLPLFARCRRRAGVAA